MHFNSTQLLPLTITPSSRISFLILGAISGLIIVQLTQNTSSAYTLVKSIGGWAGKFIGLDGGDSNSHNKRRNKNKDEEDGSHQKDKGNERKSKRVRDGRRKPNSAVDNNGNPTSEILNVHDDDDIDDDEDKENLSQFKKEEQEDTNYDDDDEFFGGHGNNGQSSSTTRTTTNPQDAGDADETLENSRPLTRPQAARRRRRRQATDNSQFMQRSRSPVGVSPQRNLSSPDHRTYNFLPHQGTVPVNAYLIPAEEALLNALTFERDVLVSAGHSPATSQIIPGPPPPTSTATPNMNTASVLNENNSLNFHSHTAAGHNQNNNNLLLTEDEEEDQESLDMYIDRDEDASTGISSSINVESPIPTYKEESENLISLLHSIAEDQARKDGFVHRSITCNHCGVSPVRGVRFKCSNCVDFDLCENCEALEVHNKTHVFLKIRVPIPPLANPRVPLLAPIYPGKPFENMETRKDWSELEMKTHFDRVELIAFYEEFKSLSTVDRTNGGITKEIFDHCLGPMGLERNLIVERIFSFFDQDQDDLISFEELVQGVSVLCKGSLDERIKYAFKGYDLDGDGVISREELLKMFKAYFHLSMELFRDVVKAMEDGLMESFDDEAAKPVSAAFAVPIPSSSDHPGANDENDRNGTVGPSGNNGNSSSSNNNQKSRKMKLKSYDQDFNGSILLEGYRAITSRRTTPTTTLNGGIASSSTSNPPSTTKSTIGLGSRTFRSPYQFIPTSPQPGAFMTSNPASAQQSPNMSPTSDAEFIYPTRLPSTSSYVRALDENVMTSFGLSPSLHPYMGMVHDDMEHYPVMEAMSQEAIEEMVEKTFQAAGAQDRLVLTFDEFKKVVEEDSNLLAWFEALGSVF